MPTFEETLETIRSDEASLARLFGGDGRRVQHRATGAQVAEVARFMTAVDRGDVTARQFREVMSTSDFPNLFGDVLSRQLLAEYRAWPTTWPAIARRSVVPDFRAVKRFASDGLDGQLEFVAELAEYPEGALDDKVDTYSVEKYGRKVALSWETMVNDDLGNFATLPARLARGARRSEEKFVTGLYVDANGPHASLYTVGHANIVTGNPALTTAGLQTAMTVLAAQTDPGGEPIMFDVVTLVVPPALEITARNILNALSIDLRESGGTDNQRLVAENWMRGRVTLVVNPYIPIIASTLHGSTSWFLFGNPADNRPAIEVGFLRGNEDPALFQRTPNATRVGGGTVPEDFDTESIEWKVRHIYGGAQLLNTGGYRSTVASSGAAGGS